MRNGEEEEEEEEEEVLSKGGHYATNGQKPSKKHNIWLSGGTKESKRSNLEGYSEGPTLLVIGCAREEQNWETPDRRRRKKKKKKEWEWEGKCEQGEVKSDRE